MNKRGFTILELLISIALISIVLLLLMRVMMSLEGINHDMSYASDDEIGRVKLIKNIEGSFLEKHLNGLQIEQGQDTTVITFFMDEEVKLEVSSHQLVFQGEVYLLNSKNATYQTCVQYEYMDLDQVYYLITLTIPVLVDGVNTTNRDDVILSYIGLRNEFTQYPSNLSC